MNRAYPSERAADVLRNGLLFSVCGPLGMPTVSTPFEALLLPEPPLSPLPQAARLDRDRMPASAKAAGRVARMDPPSRSLGTGRESDYMVVGQGVLTHRAVCDAPSQPCARGHVNNGQVTKRP